MLESFKKTRERYINYTNYSKLKNMDKEITTIQVSKEMRKKLNIQKQQLDCKSIEELLDKILKIVPADKLNSEVKDGTRNG